MPRDVRSFTGRVSELDQLVAAMDAGDGLVIRTLDGMAGVGKTALAVHLGRRLADRFPDGQLYVPLHAHTAGRQPADPHDMIARLLLLLGVTPRRIPADPVDRVALWRSELARRRVLLVLDDAVNDTQVEPLLPGSAGSAVLVTSRRRLLALDGAVPLDVPPLPKADARDLLLRLSGRTGSGPDEDAAADMLAAACGGLPLAIALLAGRLSHHPTWRVVDLAADFMAAQDRLSELAVGRRAVSAAFEMSYHALSSGCAALFRAVALHPGDDLDAGAAGALLDVPRTLARSRLLELYESHLIEEVARGRYRMHDLLRAYAKSLASPDDQPEEARDRLSLHYCSLADRADEALRPTPADSTSTPMAFEEAIGWFRAERTNLLACAFADAERGARTTFRLASSLAYYLRHDGVWLEGRRLQQVAAVLAERSGAVMEEARAQADLGTFAVTMTDLDEAKLAFKRARVLATKLSDDVLLGYVFLGMCSVARLTGDHRKARDLARRALASHEMATNLPGVVNSEMELGILARLVGDYSAASAHLTRLVDLATNKLHAPLHAALGALHLGELRFTEDRHEEADRLLTAALAGFRKVGNRTGEAQALRDLGTVRALADDHENAVPLLEQALMMYEELAERLGEGNTRQQLAAALIGLGRYTEAERQLVVAQRLFRTIGHRLGEATAMRNLGEARLLAGDSDAAAAILSDALTIYRSSAQPLGVANTLRNLAEVRITTGELDRGLAEAEEALTLYLKLGAPKAIAETQDLRDKITARIGADK
ncbi:ATP-binding protein [Amycolatopsis sp. NPDC003731]